MEYSFTGGDSSAKIYDSGTQSAGLPGFSAFAGGLTYTFTLISSNEYNFSVSGGGAVYNVASLGGTANTPIDSFSIFNRGNNDDYQYGSISVSDVALTYTANTSETKTVTGVIPDNGSIANTTEKLGAGTVIFSGANTYSGGTTISAGTLSISNDGNLGAAAGGVTINGGINSVLAISSSLTLNASRTILIGTSGGKLDAGANTLTIAGTLTNNSGNNHLFILANGNTTVSGDATGAGDIVKQGTGTLTLNGSANTFGTATANIYLDNGVVQGASSSAFGQTSSGGGVINMGANAVGNNGPATLLLTSAGASVANAINARYFSGFNASKTVGGNNTSGTATFTGNITLNDSLNLTAAPGGTVVFNGILQTGTATGGQSVNGTPGVAISGGGTVVLGGHNTYGGTTVVSNGTLQVLGSTAADSAVSVLSGTTLGGTGTISGTLTINSGGTLAPGHGGLGTLTTAAGPSLGGTTLLEINRASSPNADKLNRTGGSLAFGGALVVTNLGGSLVSGDTFDLFDATSFSGSFASTNLPPGGATHWITSQLGVDGTITFTNNAPVALAKNYSVAQGGVITLPLSNGAKFLVTDADGDAVAVTEIGAANAVDFGVAIISGGGTSITYTNTSGATGAVDVFSYTVSDGFGGLATNSISIRIDPAQGANLVSAAAEGGFAYLTYAGIPGTNYALDWATNITYPITWTQVQVKTAGGDGMLRFTNLLSSYPTNDYFRTRYVP